MSRSVLIIGDSPAGMQAALDLADTGIGVDLISAAPFLNPAQPTSGTKNSQNARLLNLAKHPLIRMWTGTRVTRVDRGPDGLKIAVERQPRYVDLSRCTACGDCIEACPVTIPESKHKAIFLQTGSQPGCAAIDKQGTAPCTNACPGGIPVQGYVAMIAQGRFREALKLIEGAIPFPGICGRICTHPCEINCRRNEVDTPVAIRALKRFIADWALQQPQELPATPVALDPEAPRVAVVGSGPAGMTAALHLVQRGYRVTVFEKLPMIAGMMAVGIPAYRLPRDVIEREYRRILDLGVELRLNTAIGPDGEITLDELFDTGFSAVCLAVGAHRSLNLNIPGEGLPGVVHGTELLKLISLSQQLEDVVARDLLDQIISKGSETRALLLGGGNTAMDVSRSLRRMGLKDVRIVYRRSREEMPAMPEEIADAETEGVAIDFLTAPMEILGDKAGGVAGLKCIRMRLGEPDASGRRRPVPVEKSKFSLGADLIVLAIGQTPDLAAENGLAINRRGRIQVNAPGFSTSRPGIFAAGDAVAHDRMAVIEAIGMGKQAAVEIDDYLRENKSDNVSLSTHRLPEILKPLSALDRRPLERMVPPKIETADAVGTFNEVELSLSAAQATAEADRCLVCGPCSECLACVEVCKPEAVVHHEQPLTAEIRTGTVICANGLASDSLDLLEGCDNIDIIQPDDLSAASAAATQAVAILAGQGKTVVEAESSQGMPAELDSCLRIGIFICRCMDQISTTVDTSEICREAMSWPGVVSASELDVSCSPEGAAAIRTGIEADNLDRVVLAACSCCTLNQACFSCTFQRVRCKQNLGVLPVGDHVNSSAPFNLGEMGLGAHQFEFVNIREHCAWAHKDNPSAASAKAVAMVAAAAAKSRLPVSRLGRNQGAPGGLTARVEPERCRACYTCVATCEIKAVTVNGSEQMRSAHVDPAVCNGCGSCAAHCPSNAIDIPAATDDQIEAMIVALLD